MDTNGLCVVPQTRAMNSQMVKSFGLTLSKLVNGLFQAFPNGATLTKQLECKIDSTEQYIVGKCNGDDAQIVSAL